MSDLDIAIAEIIAEHQAKRAGLTVDAYIAKLVVADYLENKDRQPVKKRGLDQSVQVAYERWEPEFRQHLWNALHTDRRVYMVMERSINWHMGSDIKLYTNPAGEFLSIQEWYEKIQTELGCEQFLGIRLAGEHTYNKVIEMVGVYLETLDE